MTATVATVTAILVITSAPIERTGRRSGDPPDSPGSEFAFVTAKGEGGTKFELYALTPTMMGALGKLRAGDTAHIRGAIAVRVDNGVPVLCINVLSCAMGLPIAKKAPARPKAPKPGRCGKGTMMATRAGVEAADREWRERTESVNYQAT